LIEMPPTRAHATVPAQTVPAQGTSRQRIPNETAARELTGLNAGQNGQPALFCPSPILSCPYYDRA
jgi:hypothetical protein